MTKNIRDKILTILIILSIIPIVGSIYYYLRTSKLNDIDQINKSFEYTKGIVVKKTVYKGRFIDVRYIVNGKSYVESDGMNEKVDINEGDSVMVKYSTEKPELMITQFNDQF